MEVIELVKVKLIKWILTQEIQRELHLMTTLRGSMERVQNVEEKNTKLSKNGKKHHHKFNIDAEGRVNGVI